MVAPHAFDDLPDRVPVWEARRLERRLRGRTHPLVVEAVLPQATTVLIPGADEQYVERRLWVVKAVGLPEVTDRNLFCEYFGARLASEMGIPVPEVAHVRLTPDFVEVVHPFLEDGSALQPGLGVGSAYIAPGFLSARSAPLTIEQRQQAALIYGFDLVTQNPDRRVGNENCGVCDGRVTAFDFESAFSFLLPMLGETAKPWELSRLGFRRDHVFYADVRVAGVVWSPFVAAINALSDDLLARICGELPARWKHYSESVCGHLTAVRGCPGGLEVELARSVA